jgi:NAD(P)-dependent dehydrogenase (short-subunit alcohol dehydrogenase family)
MLFSFPGFIASQFRTLHVPDVGDLSGRVVIVTGSNTSVFLPFLTRAPSLMSCPRLLIHSYSGLGLEAARILSRHDPARLILAVRNIKAGEEAARSITESNGGKCVPEVWSLDLGKLSSVKEFCDRAEKELERLDIVVSSCPCPFEVQSFALTDFARSDF